AATVAGVAGAGVACMKSPLGTLGWPATAGAICSSLARARQVPVRSRKGSVRGSGREVQHSIVRHYIWGECGQQALPIAYEPVHFSRYKVQPGKRHPAAQAGPVETRAG